MVGVKNVLKLFYTFSGLKVNCAKCELYFLGVRKESLEEIQNYTGFKLGILPVRYLRMPLITRRLTKKDCVPLVDKKHNSN